MEASKRVVKLMTQILFIIAVIVIVDALSTFFRGTSRTDIAFTETQIAFSGVSGEEIVIHYSDIVSIELLKAPDYGEPADGRVDNNIRVGTWKSNELGTYISYTATSIESCLLIHTSDHTYAVNYENDETTALLVDELNKYL